MMNGYGLVMVVTVVVGGLVLASAGGLAMEDTAQPSPTVDNKSMMGERLGAFMQSSTAAAASDIDRGMYEESLNGSADKKAAIRERIADLEAEYDAAKNRSNRLDSNSTLPDPVRRATMIRLTIQLDSLNTSIMETERHAKTVGVDTKRLERLRTNASELSGPEVAEIARGLAGVNPPGLSDGHQGNGTQGNGTQGSDNQGNGHPGNNSPGNGYSGEGNGAGSGTGGGPPDGVGNGPPGAASAESTLWTPE